MHPAWEEESDEEPGEEAEKQREKIEDGEDLQSNSSSEECLSLASPLPFAFQIARGPPLI